MGSASPLRRYNNTNKLLLSRAPHGLASRALSLGSLMHCIGYAALSQKDRYKPLLLARLPQSGCWRHFWHCSSMGIRNRPARNHWRLFLLTALVLWLPGIFVLPLVAAAIPRLLVIL